MFGAHAATVEARPLPAELFPRLGLVVLTGALAWLATRMIVRARGEDATRKMPAIAAYPIASAVLLAASMIHLANAKFLPLIYFKF